MEWKEEALHIWSGMLSKDNLKLEDNAVLILTVSRGWERMVVCCSWRGERGLLLVAAKWEVGMTYQRWPYYNNAWEIGSLRMIALRCTQRTWHGPGCWWAGVEDPLMAEDRIEPWRQGGMKWNAQEILSLSMLGDGQCLCGSFWEIWSWLIPCSLFVLTFVVVLGG